MRGVFEDAYTIFFFLIVFTNAYVVAAYLNCFDKDLSRQFKWVPATYAFIKKYR